MMKKYWDSLSKEQQDSLALEVGSTTGYLRLIFNSYKKAGFSLVKKIDEVTAGAVNKSELRPDIYPKATSGFECNQPQGQGVDRGN